MNLDNWQCCYRVDNNAATLEVLEYSDSIHWAALLFTFSIDISPYFKLWWLCQIGYTCKRFLNTSHEQAFVNVRIFNLLVKSHLNQTLPSCYCKNGNEKKGGYDELVQNVKHGTFTPLVFSALGPIATTFYKRLFSLFAIRQV